MGLILLRHTRPDAAAGLCYGRSDLGLAPCFDDHARAIARELPALARIISSPLRRCLDLAGHIAQARGLGVQTDPRLAEMDFGIWEGRPWAEIPRADLEAWAQDLLHARPHGGETVAELRTRALAALRAHAAPDTLIVTHHGIIKCARFLTEGARAWRSELPFGGWLRFDPKVFSDAP